MPETLHSLGPMFVQACESGVMSSSTLMGVAVPLLQQAIIEGRHRTVLSCMNCHNVHLNVLVSLLNDPSKVPHVCHVVRCFLYSLFCPVFIRNAWQKTGITVAGKSGEGGHEMKDRERDQEANVVDTAVQVLGTVAGQLGWPQYQELLGTFNRAMQRTESKVGAVHGACGYNRSALLWCRRTRREQSPRLAR